MLRQWGTLFFLSLSMAAWGAESGNALPANPEFSAYGRGGWRSVGPAPAPIEAPILSDPASRTIYLGTLGGPILKSTNGGATFKTLDGGPYGVTATVMAPNNPDVIYASDANIVLKTTDGGVTWNFESAGGGGGVSLAMDASDPETLYSGLSPTGGVLKTTDGGVTWSPVTESIGEPAVFSIVTDPIIHNIVYIGTVGSGAFKSIDGGATWQPLNIDSTHRSGMQIQVLSLTRQTGAYSYVRVSLVLNLLILPA